ncbi:transposase [Streptomyces sp. A1136]|uniref:transposase n=1 Tax=Streptomyces sp. A1136 TaxID=2563102 RepID=UPI001F0D9FE2|nr:transposase [Streptomyces sp. A1136]
MANFGRTKLSGPALSHHLFTGLQRRRLNSLITELAEAWMPAEEGRLHERRGRSRLRAAGAGPNHQLVFTDRVIATLVVLRFQLPHGALALLYGVDRSTITRAVHEVRPLLAARGFAVPGQGDLRLRALADVFAYEAAEDVELRLDGTEVRVRRPWANKPGRRAFVSGKMRQNTKKATVVTDGQGRTLWGGAFRPGRMHDQTAVKTEGIWDLFEQYPQVRERSTRATGDLPSSSSTRYKHAAQTEEGRPARRHRRLGRGARHQQSSGRICVEHANAEHKQWRTLQCYLGRREYFDETYAAVATLAPTAPPRDEHQADNPPGQHAPTSFVHRAVRQARGCSSRRR